MPSPRPLARFWSVFGALAHRRHLVIALSGILTFLGCLVVNASRGHDPIPEIHDEHAYLLAGDTFAHCRLTNPPHPVWKSLETFHQLQRPTYQAKYPPGQGLFLALGQVLTGRPIVGVWISCSLFVSALCWMLWRWEPWVLALEMLWPVVIRPACAAARPLSPMPKMPLLMGGHAFGEFRDVGSYRHGQAVT